MRGALWWVVLISWGSSCTGCAGLVGPGGEADAGADASASLPTDSGALSDAGALTDAGETLDGAVIIEPVLLVDAGAWSQVSWPEYSRVPAYFGDPAMTDSAAAIMTTEVPWREFSRPVIFDGGIYYFGGGHSGYSGNDIMRFDTASATWRQLYRPHVPPRDDSTYYSGGSQRVYLDPLTGAWEPFVVHNYVRSTWLPGRGYSVMIRCPSAEELATRDSGVADQPYGLASYDEAAGTWSCDTRSDEGSIIVNTGEYDPDLGGILGWGTRYDFTAFSVHRGSSGWVMLKSFEKTVLGPHGFSGQQSLYVPELRGHLIFVMPQAGSFAPSVTFFDSRTLTLTPIELPAALLRDADVEGALSAAYDSARREVVLFVKWKTGSRVWRSATAPWRFELENDRGPDFTSVGAPDRTAVVYDAHTNAFYFVQANGGDSTTGKWPKIAVWRYLR